MSGGGIPTKAPTPRLEDMEQEDLLPPENFAMVDTGVYRSSFPMKKHFPFLKRLRLKTILTLVMEAYPPANVEFNEIEGIRLIQVGVDGNKEPFKYIPHEDAALAVRHIRDPANHPLLIHCNKGKHRTGCVVGCFRKTQQWGLSSIFDEYIRFAAPKARMVDQRYIELFRYVDTIPPSVPPAPLQHRSSWRSIREATTVDERQRAGQLATPWPRFQSDPSGLLYSSEIRAGSTNGHA